MSLLLLTTLLPTTHYLLLSAYYYYSLLTTTTYLALAQDVLQRRQLNRIANGGASAVALDHRNRRGVDPCVLVGTSGVV